MSDQPSQHVPVMVPEVLQLLALRPGAVVVDGTAGGGGHLRALLDRVGPTGQVIAIDRDPQAIERLESELRGPSIRLVCDSYAHLPQILQELQVPAVDGVLLDLGISSDQLADPARGFSFQIDGPLDLRFNPQSGDPAWRLIERLNAQQLADLIYTYGEERHSRRIARAIVLARQQEPIRSSFQLAQIIRKSMPGKRRKERIDPATRSFQALRIAVNEELRELETALRCLPDCLQAAGRLAIISFHSLEDRRVKQAFRDDPRLTVVTRKPVRPTADEVFSNPRSRSAKLRVAMKSEAAAVRPKEFR